MNLEARVTSEDQLVRLLQVGVVLEARAQGRTSRSDSSETDFRTHGGATGSSRYSN